VLREDLACNGFDCYDSAPGGNAMAKTDPILGGSAEPLPERAPRPMRGGTMPLLSADARSSKRKTEPMLGPDGLLRDTVRDLLPPAGLSASSDGGEELAPWAHARVVPRAAGEPLVASDRKVSLEGFVPRSNVPAGSNGPRVDVSRVDPRRAPTQKIQRRPPGVPVPTSDTEAYAGASKAAASDGAKGAVEARRVRGGEPVWVVLAVLCFGAVALVSALAWRLSASPPSPPIGNEEGAK
jgi:hypothetical protein